MINIIESENIKIENTKTENIEKLYYTFDNLIDDLHILVDKIKNDNWEPDIIIGPCRGAYIPGVMLSHYYNKPFQGFIWQTRDGNIQDISGLNKILDENMDKNILIIDDINDSGLTLNGINDVILSHKYTNNIKYAVLFNKTTSNFKEINYYSNEMTLENNKWIVFPYEEF